MCGLCRITTSHLEIRADKDHLAHCQSGNTKKPGSSTHTCQGHSQRDASEASSDCAVIDPVVLSF